MQKDMHRVEMQSSCRDCPALGLEAPLISHWERTVGKTKGVRTVADLADGLVAVSRAFLRPAGVGGIFFDDQTADGDKVLLKSICALPP